MGIRSATQHFQCWWTLFRFKTPSFSHIYSHIFSLILYHFLFPSIYLLFSSLPPIFLFLLVPSLLSISAYLILSSLPFPISHLVFPSLPSISAYLILPFPFLYLRLSHLVFPSLPSISAYLRLPPVGHSESQTARIQCERSSDHIRWQNLRRIKTRSHRNTVLSYVRSMNFCMTYLFWQ